MGKNISMLGGAVLGQRLLFFMQAENVPQVAKFA
jgi:hypothetical protein